MARGYKDHGRVDLSDRVYRELIERCRADGIPLAFVWLPESSLFRRLYSAKTESAVIEYWKHLTQEWNVPGLDFRFAMPDENLPDGFHLTQIGAAKFGPVFADELRRAFPDLGGNE